MLASAQNCNGEDPGCNVGVGSCKNLQLFRSLDIFHLQAIQSKVHAALLTLRIPDRNQNIMLAETNFEALRSVDLQ